MGNTNTGRTSAVRAAAAAAVLGMAVTGCSESTVIRQSSAPAQSSTAAPSSPSSAAAPSSSAAATGAARDLTAARSTPVEDRYYPQHGEPYLDTLHYGLELDWKPSQKVLTGTAKITFRLTSAQKQVRFDMSDALKVTSASINGRTLSTSRPGTDQLQFSGDGLAADRQYVLTVRYSGTPTTVPMPSSRADSSDGNGLHITSDNQLWTMQEPHGALTWYPVNDHPSDKAFYDATLVSREGQQGVFNGVLTQRSTVGGVTTSRFRLDQPAASYLTTLAYGPYELQRAKLNDGKPALYWYTAEDKDSLVVQSLQETPEIIGYLETLLGPYPYASVGAVAVPADSAMETQTMVTFGTQNRYEFPSVEGTLAHEYAHQWLGNKVSPQHWDEVWLNEGLTMFVQVHYMAHRGYQPADVSFEQIRPEEASSRSEAGPPGAYDKGAFAENNVYFSGALMLDAMAKAYGQKFWAGLKSWTTATPSGTVTRQDFIRHFSKAVGVDIGPWVTSWLTDKTTPTQAPPTA
ncbi:M1 family aminopeptidase [Dermacoccaceae bacterium W4C1]